jgi:hypothetical protein
MSMSLCISVLEVFDASEVTDVALVLCEWPGRYEAPFGSINPSPWGSLDDAVELALERSSPAGFASANIAALAASASSCPIQ